MRQTTIVAAIAFAVATVGVLGATAGIGHSPKPSQLASTGMSLDIMGMMKNAKNLPEESYDAH